MQKEATSDEAPPPKLHL
ncbi:uncharacterized protein FTOL_00075 [Fusarium torulosum]|uniref:Uncharacterized protein n=1 Tax=Fusarium torulosum TaxID=33205 RepID=A0AAE8LXI1_9HYPO|nr:uncharacterized protein FTOL_00075 [Fusarium torulosum]